MTLTRKDIESRRLRHPMELCKLVEELGYRSILEEFHFSNGSYLSNLADFLEDNPGAMDAIQGFILEHGRDRDGVRLPDDVEWIHVTGIPSEYRWEYKLQLRHFKVPQVFSTERFVDWVNETLLHEDAEQEYECTNDDVLNAIELAKALGFTVETDRKVP